MYVFQMKSPKESKYAYNHYKLLKTVAGDDVDAASGALAKTRAGSKSAQVVAMLQDRAVPDGRIRSRVRTSTEGR
jgi:hypothetical protein